MGELIRLSTAPTPPPGWELRQRGRQWSAVRPWRTGRPGVALLASSAAEACDAARTFEAAASALGAAAAP